MRIGVDIRSILVMSRGGVPHYTRSLVSELVSQFPDDQWHLLQSGRRPFVLPNELDRPNVTVHHQRRSNRISNLATALGSRRLVSAVGQLDVFFAPTIGFLRLPHNLPYVLTLHDLSFLGPRRYYPWQHYLWHRLVEPRRLITRASRLIAVSEQTAREVQTTYALDPQRIAVVHSGIDARYGQAVGSKECRRVTAKYRLPRQYFFYLGAIEKRKNIDGLLRGWQLAQAAGLSAELVLAGSNKPPQPLPAGVRWLGYVDEADKPALYRMATACLLVSWHEGFGFPPLEALAAGTPSIVSDLPVFRETLAGAALRVNPAAPDELAEKLVHLEQHPAEAAKLVRNGQSIVRRLTWQACAQQTYQVLKEAAHAK